MFACSFRGLGTWQPGKFWYKSFEVIFYTTLQYFYWWNWVANCSFRTDKPWLLNSEFYLYSTAFPLFNFCSTIVWLLWCRMVPHSRYVYCIDRKNKPKQVFFTLVEYCKFHTAIQYIHQKLTSHLHNTFYYSKHITGHIGWKLIDSVFLE